MSPRTPPPFKIGQMVRLLTNGGYSNNDGAYFTPGSVHPIACVHGSDMGVSLRSPLGYTLYFSPYEFIPTVPCVAGARAKGKRRYSITHYADGWACRGPGRKVVAICMSRADARKFAQMKNAERT